MRTSGIAQATKIPLVVMHMVINEPSTVITHAPSLSIRKESLSVNVWLRTLESILKCKWSVLIGRDGGRTDILSGWMDVLLLRGGLGFIEQRQHLLVLGHPPRPEYHLKDRSPVIITR